MRAGSFQSSRPLRGATRRRRATRAIPCNFNPRAPCGARLKRIATFTLSLLFQSSRPLRGATGAGVRHAQYRAISILAPLAGRDFPAYTPQGWGLNFNPRAPCGARPVQLFQKLMVRHISILAPLAGRDLNTAPSFGAERNFNPRAPCGARRLRKDGAKVVIVFQSSRPLRGATMRSQKRRPKRPRFQSSRPLRGATDYLLGNETPQKDFNPRAPCGARPRTITTRIALDGEFQSSRPLRGATAKMHKNRVCFCNNRQRTNAFSPVKRRLSGR